MLHEDMFEGVLMGSIWVKRGIDDYSESLHAFDYLCLHTKFSLIAPFPQTPADLTHEPIFTCETPVTIDPIAGLVA